ERDRDSNEERHRCDEPRRSGLHRTPPEGRMSTTTVDKLEYQKRAVNSEDHRAYPRTGQPYRCGGAAQAGSTRHRLATGQDHVRATRLYRARGRRPWHAHEDGRDRAGGGGSEKLLVEDP